MTKQEIMEILNGKEDNFNLKFEEAEENIVIEHLKVYYIKGNKSKGISAVETTISGASSDCCGVSVCVDVPPYACS
jgi:hypothetical protein